MKNIALMLAIAAALLMGQSTFAHNTGHGHNHGYNHGNGHGHHGKHRKKRRRPPVHHCHTKRVRVHPKPHWRGGHGGHHRGHGHHRAPKWRWVQYCHTHRNPRRAH